MKAIITNDVVRTLLVLGVLLCLKGAYTLGWASAADALVETLSNRGLNKEAREELTAGYYEGLINEGSRLSSMNRLVTGPRRITFEDRSQPDRRETNDFHFYELIPNSDIPDYRDERYRYRLRTNSAGLADREYTLEKPDGVYRIALMGDSVTRGQGAPYLGNYESLLEARLNEGHLGGDVTGIEILNLSVGSYNVTQMFETALVTAAPYEPDVYAVAMTRLSVYRRWGQHIALLMNAGIDLKYDFLRAVVREAGLRADDPIGVTDAKLARFRFPTIRWVLTELQAHAAARNARVVVLLVPTAGPPAAVTEDFLGVWELVSGLGIPIVDVRDTFDGVNPLDYAVAHNDDHPNAAGHERLFERMYARVVADPDLTRIFTGRQ